MKTKLLLLSCALLICVLVLSFCSNSNGTPVSSTTSSDDSIQSLDTALNKYLGLYQWKNSYYSVGRFPSNTRVHTQTGDKFLPLDKKFYGRYFLVADNKVMNRPFYCQTEMATSYAGGYLAADKGNLLLGVGGDGTIQIQNYDNFGTQGDLDTLSFNLGGTGTYGKFVQRADGKYDLAVNNVEYEWVK